MIPELLSPAGSWDCLHAAVANGADAVYFGLPRFNARMRADNFTEEELPEVTRYCREHGVKSYVAFNTLVFTSELDDAAHFLRVCSRAGVDALIVQDVGLVRMARQMVPDLPLHASTQMTVTSPEGAAFAASLGVERVVLARELSLRELAKFDGTMPLEVFVHGALCVAYSGQCLTSEALGQRSANRGECAQACRMPYELIVDGAVRDLGDRRYLLSPQDLAGIDDIPALIERGVASFKIEGRLKTPEYVAAVTQVYRKAIDAAVAQRPAKSTAEDRYQLEMTFSRGLFSGWLHGVDHQQLVHATHGKKRGPFAGRIVRVANDHVEVDLQIPVVPGDGVVFDTGEDTNTEQGGRVYEVRGKRLFFKHRHINFRKLSAGNRVWKTDDPALNQRLRQSFSMPAKARNLREIDVTVRGEAGSPLHLTAGKVAVESRMRLDAARNAPLTCERFIEHFGRFGGAALKLGDVDWQVNGTVILPISEMNRMRRELMGKLSEPPTRRELGLDPLVFKTGEPSGVATLHVLCRDVDQIAAVLAEGVDSVYADFEDIRRYREAVQLVRRHPGATIHLATPRIQKAGETGFFKLIEGMAPDGVLVRNLGGLEHFQNMERIGDFSLNVANPWSAQLFLERGLLRLTASYDLDINQVLDLLRGTPPGAFEITLHQHMPMFHMEHCVFAAFLSKGTDHTNCGRPCDTHRVALRDRTGREHPLRADVGCRNTLFNAVPQTAAKFYELLRAAGAQHFRIELLGESGEETRRVVRLYQALLSGEAKGGSLWRELKAQSQFGVTRGTL